MWLQTLPGPFLSHTLRNPDNPLHNHPACILVSDLVFTSKEEAAREKYQADCLRFFHSIVKNILWSQDKVKEFFKEIKK